ncbi:MULTISPECIES: class I SAM-dependent methyltransferase [Methylobacterium]|jgi:16S rRNA (guanine1207-N2)-methyltransferase|uniref:Methyltransferase n=1 Tax=Methylobacterium brachiatum TaxID=269660 RepID=A0ABV1R186_9HYPH|nr:MULTISPECIES: methyltransferase [Methylobacterium]EIZ85324.1 methyltransferase small [Methylobacterium sp. GXF4]MDF2600975.1 methyltransferase small [Methylobacterium brachiatum]SFI75283.1 16S rRNA (guanine1207-N2)-methyltransferase [Methylobacterium brachiatum]
MRHAVYGLPPVDLAEVPGDAVQLSPLIPGSARLEDLTEGSLDAATVLAPPGTIERRYVLAHTLRALVPGGRMLALAPKDRGGTRLAKELAAFACHAADEPRRHHRICRLVRPPEPAGLGAAIEEGGPRHVDNLALCTQPGVFSWDRLDPGTALLLANLPPLKGKGADLGCGLGILARAILGSPAVTALTLVEIDRRAVEMAHRNVADPRATIVWADIRAAGAVPGSLDFVVMNPPFHDGGTEDQALGRTFIARAAEALRKGGTLWLVANAHLPYETALGAAFRDVSVTVQAGGYRVYEARR